LGQVLNARGSFGPYMWSPVVNNIVSIIGFGAFLVLFGRFSEGGRMADPSAWTAGPITLVGGVATLGIVAQALVLLWPLHRIGFRFRPSLDWRGAGLATAGGIAGWTLAAQVVGQLGILVVINVANSAGAGAGAAIAGNNAYGNAFMIFMLPHSLVTVSLLTAMFTRMSGHAAADDTAAVRGDVDTGLRLIGVFTVIAGAVIAVLALPMVRVIWPTTLPLASASLPPIIVALTLGLPALGVWALVQRVHYSYEDAKGLFAIQVAMGVVVAAGAVLARLVLPRSSWVAGAALAIAVSYTLGAVWGGISVRRRIGGIGTRGTLGVVVRALLAGAVAVAVGWPLSRQFGDLSQIGFAAALGVCVLVGLVMLGLYAALLYALGVEELTELAAPLLRAARRSMGSVTTRLLRRRTEGEGVEVTIGQGTQLAGRYRLEHPTPFDLPGAECWTAHDQILDRPVRALLLREGRVHEAQDAARRAALVTDPRLLRVLDVGSHEGIAYMVTERVPGRDLGQLTAHGPLPADQARAIVGEAAVALEVARRRGVHHLALRPSAVHVTPAGAVVVSGLAVDGELTGEGPRDARSTTRTDAVALVALLYLALTGRWPSPDGAPAHGMAPAPLMAGDPIAPAEISPGVPNDLDTLCTVTLGPNDDGPHSPAELVRELEPWGTITAIEPATARAGRPSRVVDTAVDVPLPGPHDAPADGAAAQGEQPDGVVGAQGLGTGLDTHRGSAPDAPVVAPRGRGAPPPAIPPTLRRGDPRVTAASAGGGGITVPAPSAGGAGAAAPVSVPAPQPAARPAPTGAARPPHPPRDRPVRTSAFGLFDDVPPAQPPAIPPGPPAPHEESRSFDEVLGRSAGALVRKRFNPTPLVLALVAILIVIGIGWAWKALTKPAPPIGGTDGFGNPVDISQTPSTSTTDSPSASATQSPTPTDLPTAAPVIASAQQVDPPPQGDNNEHPELVGRAIDGDPSTMWVSRTYKNPKFGMKPGIGYAVILAKPAMVSEVTLLTSSTGGHVEVRATSPDKPTEGTVLASGPLSPTTVLTFSKPVEASSIVLWFTELPQTADGRNRVELHEVTLG
jgi:peptidoglycan biosynthesis protein MviN/MurJ (putative lipid II flippase)